jgi:RHS repeat-associated protein
VAMRRRIQSLVAGFCLAIMVATLSVPMSIGAQAAQGGPANTRTTPSPAIFVPGPAIRATSPQTVPTLNAKSTAAPRELLSKRTRTSKTFAVSGGYELVSYPQSVHFQDSTGAWRAIDATLVTDERTHEWHDRAAAYVATLPNRLDQAPVRFAVGSKEVDFHLLNAAGQASVAGSTATYSDAWQNATVVLTTEPDGVKEEVILPHAPASTINYSLAERGVSARPNAAGGLDFADADGRVVFGFNPPTVIDAGGTAAPASWELHASGSATSVALAVDPQWYSAANRRYPVTVDPTVTISYNGSSVVKTFSGANQDCYIESGTNASSSFCSASTTLTGSTTTAVDRALLQFNVSIPSDATVLNADLAMQLKTSASTSAVPVEVHTLTQSWSTTASWNNAATGTPWTTPGGTYNSAASWTTSVGPTTGSYHWYLSPVLQNWVQGSTTNLGFVLKTSTEAGGNRLTFYSSRATQSSTWPTLTVKYQLAVGVQGWYPIRTQKLTDHLEALVNTSSGNLVLHQKLFNIRGIADFNEDLELYYNNLAPNVWDFGRSWFLNTGWDVWLGTNDGDGVSFFGPSGWAYHFVKNADGSYQQPLGLAAQLVRNADQTYTLTYDQSGEQLHFNSTGTSLLSDADRNGHQITFSYNTNGALTSIADTQGRLTTLSYVGGGGSTCSPPTSSGFVSAVTDPAGRSYQFSYDSSCDLVQISDPDNHVTHITYNSNTEPTLLTDPNSKESSFAYDSAFRVTAVTRITNTATQTGYNWTYAYNAGTTVETDANGHATTYYPDAKDRLVKVVDANGNASNYSYNANNNVTQITDALSQAVNVTYDSQFNQTSTQLPPASSGQSGPTVSFTYTAPSQPFLPSARVDAQGNCTAYVYDTAGNLTDVYAGQAAPCAGNTGGTHVADRFQGDAGVSCGAKVGERCSTVDAAGSATTYGYDTSGNLLSVTPPAPIHSTSLSLDSLSRIVGVTDGNANVTSISYDKEDHVTQILYGGATTCSTYTTCTQFTYDSDGNLTSRIDSTGTTSFYYDALNRLITKVLPNSAIACSGSNPAGITMGYDGVGNETSYCDAGGALTYGYDAANRLISLAEPGGTCTAPSSLCVTYVYDGDNRMTSTSFPGGATLTASYDHTGDLTSVVGKDKNGGVVTSFSYTYANSTGSQTGVRQTMTESDPSLSSTNTYTYDALNRLTQSSGSGSGGSTYQYSYDANGNILTRTVNGVSSSYAYNAANELCWSVAGASSNPCGTAPTGSTTYSYDADGNLTGSSSGLTIAYNALEQTTSVQTTGSSLSPIGYAGIGQTERTSAGGTTYASGANGLQVSTTSGAATYFDRLPSGGVVGERLSDGSHWYYLVDGLKSVVAVISGDGLTIGDRYSYDPFGNTTSHSGSTPNPWGFAGGFTDSTGLIKIGARYYDPSTAHWTQLDPVVGTVTSPGTLNRFAYAACNPVNASDPTGLYCQPLIDEANWFMGAARFYWELADSIGAWDPVVWWLDAVAASFFALALWFYFWGAWEIC